MVGPPDCPPLCLEQGCFLLVWQNDLAVWKKTSEERRRHWLPAETTQLGGEVMQSLFVPAMRKALN